MTLHWKRSEAVFIASSFSGTTACGELIQCDRSITLTHNLLEVTCKRCILCLQTWIYDVDRNVVMFIGKPAIYSPPIMPDSDFEWVQCPYTSEIFLKWVQQDTDTHIRHIKWLGDDIFLAHHYCVGFEQDQSVHVYNVTGHRYNNNRDSWYRVFASESRKVFLSQLLSHLRVISKHKVNATEVILDADIPAFQLDELRGGIPPFLLKYR